MRHASRNQQDRTGGADRIRTDDPLLAKQMLSQLSYSPPLSAIGFQRTTER